MPETTASRVLCLLPLLTSRPEWRGEELAEALGVTTRTVRRDIDRLRELGYPVIATSGKHRGSALRPGNGLPPLLLDDDSAVAVAIGQVLPARLRHQTRRGSSAKALSAPTGSGRASCSTHPPRS
jgi:predicted DNA-binding transcriptional regulator YafY